MVAQLTLTEYKAHFSESIGYLDFARWGPPSDQVILNSATALSQTSGGLTDVNVLRSEEQRALSLISAMTGRRSSDAAVLTSSTSAGLFQLAFAMNGNADTEILLSPSEFPANIYPWVRAERHGGPHVKWLSTVDGLVTPDVVASALTSATIALVVSAVDFRTGYRADLAGLREVIGDRLLLVDGIQGFGSCDIDWSMADALVVGGQKWMRASWGTGFISLSDRGLERLGDGMTGWSGVRDFSLYDGTLHEMLPTAKRFAMTNPDLISASMFAAALELADGVSIKVIDQEIQSRVSSLIEVIERYGGSTLVPLDPRNRSGIVSFTIPGLTANGIGRSFTLNGLRCSEYEDYVRLSPHATTSMSAIASVDDSLLSLIN